MEIRKQVIANNEKEFAAIMKEVTERIFLDVAKNDIGSIVAIQFKEVAPIWINMFIEEKYRISNGLYKSEDGCIDRNTIFGNITKFSREISISIVPKDLKKEHIPENLKSVAYGYVNVSYCDITDGKRDKVGE